MKIKFKFLIIGLFATLLHSMPVSGQSLYCDTTTFSTAQIFAAWSGRYVPDSCQNYITWHSMFNKKSDSLSEINIGGNVPSGHYIYSNAGGISSGVISQSSNKDTVTIITNANNGGIVNMLESGDSVGMQFDMSSEQMQIGTFSRKNRVFTPDGGYSYNSFWTGAPSPTSRDIFPDTAGYVLTGVFGAHGNIPRAANWQIGTSIPVYGIGADTILAKPLTWLSIKVGTKTYKIPLYQ